MIVLKTSLLLILKSLSEKLFFDKFGHDQGFIQHIGDKLSTFFRGPCFQGRYRMQSPNAITGCGL
jgi:hypothetical protein